MLTGVSPAEMRQAFLLLHVISSCNMAAKTKGRGPAMVVGPSVFRWHAVAKHTVQLLPLNCMFHTLVYGDE